MKGFNQPLCNFNINQLPKKIKNKLYTAANS